MKTRRVIAVAVTGTVAAVLCVVALPARAATAVCDQFGSSPVQGGRFVVQNNNWGDTNQQCVTPSDAGFSVTSGEHNKATNGPPGSYPSIFLGCHFGNCSTNSGLPAAIASISDVTSTVKITTTAGQWDAAYDVWYDPTPRTDGQNTGAEVMIWINHLGAPQPIGQKISTVTLVGADWDVFSGNIGWNVISYVRQQPATSFDASVIPFEADAQSRKLIDPAWFLTSVQFGFEPWVGGPGLAAGSFSVTIS
jgi:hypothetical protein